MNETGLSCYCIQRRPERHSLAAPSRETSAKETELAFYTLEATSRGSIVRMKAPLTASQAYMRTVELRRQGFSDIVAINATTGRRITEVQRLLGDLET